MPSKRASAAKRPDLSVGGGGAFHTPHCPDGGSSLLESEHGPDGSSSLLEATTITLTWITDEANLSIHTLEALDTKISP